MAVVVAWAAVFPAIGSWAADRKEKPKPAVVDIQNLKAALDGSKINIDGVVHNSGERPIEQLVLSFHFFDTDHKPVTTLKLEVQEEEIGSGEDAEIHAASNEPPRAVSLEVTAAERGERNLKVLHPGPYPID